MFLVYLYVIFYIGMRKSPFSTYVSQFLCVLIIIAFLANTFGPMPLAQAQDFSLPAPGAMVHLSPPINPPILKGIKVDPNNPFHFDFVLDVGDGLKPSPTDMKDEATKLIKYFLASMTIPEKDLWVNLSPYEKDRIIPNSFGLTEMGRDLLAEDYMLKQITASLIYPEDGVGKKFWKRIYEEASKKYGTTSIPVNTFNKVWIMPDKAVIYENVKAGTAYVVESKLKVMLEGDYLALVKHNGPTQGRPLQNDVNSIGSQIVREIVIPELTKEVNGNKNFARLRQVYNSLILATWYKQKIKDSILSQVYADKNKVAGVNIDDPKEKERIYQQYLRAFKKGVYNYIKEDVDPVTQEMIPRKYFSGGVLMTMRLSDTPTQTATGPKATNLSSTTTTIVIVSGDNLKGFAPEIGKQEGLASVGRLVTINSNFTTITASAFAVKPMGTRTATSSGVKPKDMAMLQQLDTKASRFDADSVAMAKRIQEKGIRDVSFSERCEWAKAYFKRAGVAIKDVWKGGFAIEPNPDPSSGYGYLAYKLKGLSPNPKHEYQLFYDDDAVNGAIAVADTENRRHIYIGLGALLESLGETKNIVSKNVSILHEAIHAWFGEIIKRGGSSFLSSSWVRLIKGGKGAKVYDNYFVANEILTQLFNARQSVRNLFFGMSRNKAGEAPDSRSYTDSDIRTLIRLSLSQELDSPFKNGLSFLRARRMAYVQKQLSGQLMGIIKAHPSADNLNIWRGSLINSSEGFIYSDATDYNLFNENHNYQVLITTNQWYLDGQFKTFVYIGCRLPPKGNLTGGEFAFEVDDPVLVDEITKAKEQNEDNITIPKILWDRVINSVGVKQVLGQMNEFSSEIFRITKPLEPYMSKSWDLITEYRALKEEAQRQAKENEIFAYWHNNIQTMYDLTTKIEPEVIKQVRAAVPASSVIDENFGKGEDEAMQAEQVGKNKLAPASGIVFPGVVTYNEKANLDKLTFKDEDEKTAKLLKERAGVLMANLKEKLSTLPSDFHWVDVIGALFGKDNKMAGQDFVEYASLLRQNFKVEENFDDSRQPLEYGRTEGKFFEIGPDLFICPTTESFKRHIIFRMVKGKVIWAKEIMIPGDERINLQGERRQEVANDFYKKFDENHDVKGYVSGILKLPDLPNDGRELYGKPWPKNEKFQVVMYDYEEDGKRLSHINKDVKEQWVKKLKLSSTHDLEEKIIKGALECFLAVGYTGYFGLFDMHTENFKVAFVYDKNGVPIDVKVKLVGDFGSYVKKKNAGLLALPLMLLLTYAALHTANGMWENNYVHLLGNFLALAGIASTIHLAEYFTVLYCKPKAMSCAPQFVILLEDKSSWVSV